MKIKVGIMICWTDIIVDIVRLRNNNMSLHQIQMRVEAKEEEYITAYSL